MLFASASLKIQELVGHLLIGNSLASYILEEFQNGIPLELDLQELDLGLLVVEQAVQNLSKTCSHLRFIHLNEPQDEN